MVWIWSGVLAACVVAAWLILRRPVRHVLEDLNIDGARDQFRRRREWLEAQFLGALAKADPIERLRWEEAHWHDEIVWARDRQTRRLLALVAVHFEAESIPEIPGYPPRHATALFEYRKGHWHADGKRLDEIRPDEAFLRLQRFEPVVLPQRRGI
jgi:hypothetical protein